MFLKKLRFFKFELIDFGLEESAVGTRTATHCAFSIPRNRHEARSKNSGAHYDVMMLVRNMLISSVLVPWFSNYGSRPVAYAGF